ncbi:lipase member H isoform X1 [Paramormyrops kingsleyae]|uniref:lipase member H isoform X1 n=1 Tax=Paramormyrops kingsleyae TaxID=1676925 RepID=UPI003B96C9EA
MKSYLLLLLLCLFAGCKGQKSECDSFTDLNFHESFMGTNLSVKLLLYTGANPDCGHQLSHHDLTHQPLFNLSRRTAMVIHGYRPTGAPPIWVSHMVHLLAAQDDTNVVVVDWNRGAANINYFTAVANSRSAAANISGFIQKMQEHGASLSSIHLIGMSLGAHVAGFVGAMLKGKIGRITGLDPAGPLFNGVPPADRLDPTDALFVDVLHTDMNTLGYKESLGHIDFYANGGADQPGCPKSIFAGKSYFVCNHQRAVFLFLCALNKTCSFTAYPCSSYSDFQDGRCLSCEPLRPAPCPVFGETPHVGGAVLQTGVVALLPFPPTPWDRLGYCQRTNINQALNKNKYNYNQAESFSSHTDSIHLKEGNKPLCNGALMTDCTSMSIGYDVRGWRDIVVQQGQTRAYFSTTAESPYCKSSYRVDMVTWNQFTRWGIVVLKLHSGRRVTETRMDHKVIRFEQYTATRMLAQFDEDLHPVQKISIRFITGNIIGPKYKLRLLRIRLTPLGEPNRSGSQCV